MADVASSLRERGQLILIGGLSLAVVFVVLALVLNSAIYTENLATRTSDNPADTPIQFRQDAVAGAGSAMDYANRNGGDREFSDRYEEYQSAIDEWQRMHANYSAMNGLLTEVRTTGVRNEGTLVVDDSDTEFTSRQGDANWLVADDVGVRQFRMTVDRDSLHSLGDSEFNIEIDGASSWRVAVYEESGSVKVRSYDSDDNVIGTCTAEGSSVQIDITGGTLDGTRCEALSFVEDLPATYDISYANANSITGTYQLTVDREEGSLRAAVDDENGDTTTYFDADDGTPYTTPAIYSATIELVYDGPSVTYETTVRVAPGEPGESAVAPPMAQLDGFDGGWDDGPLGVSGRTSDEMVESGDGGNRVAAEALAADSDDGKPLSRECDAGVWGCPP